MTKASIYWSLIANCVVNVILYRHHVEHCNNSRAEKNFVVTTAFAENIAPECGCF